MKENGQHPLVTHELAMAKMYEIASRQAGLSPEIQSKFLLISLLHQYVPAFDINNINAFPTYKNDLLIRLHEHGKAHEIALIQTSLHKLENLSVEEQIQYLKKGTENEPSSNHTYSELNYISHNEQLIVPKEQEDSCDGDAVAIYIKNVNSIKACQRAFLLHEKFKQETNRDLPYVAYAKNKGELYHVPFDDIEKKANQ